MWNFKKIKLDNDKSKMGYGQDEGFMFADESIKVEQVSDADHLFASIVLSEFESPKSDSPQNLEQQASDSNQSPENDFDFDASSDEGDFDFNKGSEDEEDSEKPEMEAAVYAAIAAISADIAQDSYKSIQHEISNDYGLVWDHDHFSNPLLIAKNKAIKSADQSLLNPKAVEEARQAAKEAVSFASRYLDLEKLTTAMSGSKKLKG